MASKPATARTRLDWHEALLCLLAGAVGIVEGSPALAVLCALAAAMTIGVWRAVRLLGGLVRSAEAEPGSATRAEQPSTAG